MPFNFKQTAIPDVYLIEPKKFSDDRGYFMETYKQSDFAAMGINHSFDQDNLSYSKKGVLRGLHYQLGPKTQGKILRVLKGTILDVIVDIRKSSPTFKKWVGVELSLENGLGFYFPPGFAHSFLVLSDDALVMYKSTNEYAPELERGIRWNDPTIGIEWPIKDPIMAPRDAEFPLLADAEMLE